MLIQQKQKINNYEEPTNNNIHIHWVVNYPILCNTEKANQDTDEWNMVNVLVEKE